MATTTTNYGFDIPQSTDLVKDGATAIATLGQDIDTAMNTALGTKKAGMVLLNTTSFSAVSSQSINDVFSSTYDNYVVRLNITAMSTSIVLNMRLRVSGADNSASNYGQSLRLQDSSNNNVFDVSTVSQTLWRLGQMGTTTAYTEFTLANPFSTSATLMLNNFIRQLSATTGSMENYFGASSHATATSFTGFSILPNTGNITGSISTYGVNK